MSLSTSAAEHPPTGLPSIDVVAALIRRGDRFFICQRPANKGRALQWEFPGGKIEPGESPEEALVRECREELAVELRVGSLYAETTHTYPDLFIRLRLYNSEILSGEPQQLEHRDLRWITPDQIDLFEFCPADLDFIQKLKSER